MQRPAKPWTSVRFRPQPPIGPGGEIGRRKGLKIPRWQHRAGSSPAPGTNHKYIYYKLLIYNKNILQKLVMSQNSCNNSCKNIPGQMAIPPHGYI